MGKIQVISPGIHSSIQDEGRVGNAHFGIPKGGAMDRASMHRANALIGNDLNAPVLEITFQGPQLLFEASATIAVCGADIFLSINGKPFSTDEVFEIVPGNILKMGPCSNGVRVYLAIAGGFQQELLLGSASWTRSLTDSFRLQKGESLFFNETKQKVIPRNLPAATELQATSFEVLPGPEFSMLNDEQQRQLFNASFTLLPKSDRMAFSFSGPAIQPLSKHPFFTVPVLPGVVQWYPSGQMVLLHRDAQQTGGYPRILLFSEQALNAIAQININQSFRLHMPEFSAY